MTGSAYWGEAIPTEEQWGDREGKTDYVMVGGELQWHHYLWPAGSHAIIIKSRFALFWFTGSIKALSSDDSDCEMRYSVEEDKKVESLLIVLHLLEVKKAREDTRHEVRLTVFNSLVTGVWKVSIQLIQRYGVEGGHRSSLPKNGRPFFLAPRQGWTIVVKKVNF